MKDIAILLPYKENFTENKAALHWQIRDCDSGLYKSLFESLRKVKSQIESKKIKNIVSIGIGGSFEGPKLLIESLIDPNNSKFRKTRNTNLMIYKVSI